MKLKGLVAFVVSAVLLFCLLSSTVAEPETSEEPVEVPEITPGVIGAVAGVFVAIYTQFKLKELDYKNQGLLQNSQHLKFNLKRYGSAGLIALAIDLVLQVVIPAMHLGAEITTGDPVTDFTLAFLTGYGATELVKEGLKRLPFTETTPNQVILSEQVMS